MNKGFEELMSIAQGVKKQHLTYVVHMDAMNKAEEAQKRLRADQVVGTEEEYENWRNILKESVRKSNNNLKDMVKALSELQKLGKSLKSQDWPDGLRVKVPHPDVARMIIIQRVLLEDGKRYWQIKDRLSSSPDDYYTEASGYILYPSDQGVEEQFLYETGEFSDKSLETL